MTTAYNRLADVYEQWSSGDRAYEASGNFYRGIVQDSSGVVVELGIGTGRIGGRIATDQGRIVIGVDSSIEMLGICRDRFSAAVDDGRLSLVHKNMVDYGNTRSAEYVLLPFRTLGHLDTDDEILCVFSNVCRALEKGGRFVFDHYMFSRRWADEHSAVPVPLFYDGKVRLEDSYVFDYSAKRLKCTVRENGETRAEFSFRWFDPDDIEALLLRSGLAVESVWGDFSRSALTSDSSDQIWVARRRLSV